MNLDILCEFGASRSSDLLHTPLYGLKKNNPQHFKWNDNVSTPPFSRKKGSTNEENGVSAGEDAKAPIETSTEGLSWTMVQVGRCWWVGQIIWLCNLRGGVWFSGKVLMTGLLMNSWGQSRNILTSCRLIWGRVVLRRLFLSYGLLRDRQRSWWHHGCCVI